jgi:outer membrane protein assembly factor BamD
MSRIFFLRLLFLAPVLLPVLEVSCASTGSRGPVNTVEDMYAQAMDNLKNNLYPEALDGFETIKARFPYSKFAALADLRIADTHYERQSYVEAIDAYRNFLKYHPTHGEAPYAMFRIAEAYQQQMPTDFFILPPSAEKDQATTKLAISAFRDMLTRYPTSEYAEKAQTKLDQCRRRLADHEMYVARFYFKRDKWLASALRAEGVLRDYGGLGLDPEALLIAGSSRFYTKELVEARVHLTKLETEFPDTAEAGKAKSVLKEMGKQTLTDKNADEENAKTPAASDVANPAPSATATGNKNQTANPR